MLVPKRANCQYRYGAAHYRYWYPDSNSLVFTFLSTFFQSTIEFISICSEYLPLLVMDRANTGRGTWHIPILEKNVIAAMPILARDERHRSNANTGMGTWQVPILEMNAIAAVPIPVWAPIDAQVNTGIEPCPYWYWHCFPRRWDDGAGSTPVR